MLIDDLLRDFEGAELAGAVLGPTGMDSRDLRDRTKRFAVRSVTFARALSPAWESRRIGGQLVDSASSVFANYRAACRARSRAEFIAKIGVVVEEADESLGWLELIQALNLATGTELHWLTREGDELVAIFTASHKTARRRRNSPDHNRQ